MTEDEIRARALKVLTTVAPDVVAAEVKPDVRFRDQFDFDSMDFLNFAIGLHKDFAIDIPEADYPKLQTLAGAVAYVAARTAGAAGSASA